MPQRVRLGWPGLGTNRAHTPAVICETKHTGQDIDVVVTCLVVPPEAVRASAALLSDAEHHRARRFAFDRDARRFIVGRARLRQLLAARLGVEAEAVEVEYGGPGQPGPFRRVAGSGL